MNTKTLQLLSQKQVGVEVILFTENGHGKRGFLTTAIVSDFVQQYPHTDYGRAHAESKRR